uniref:Uncharacterized protein n=1 Tax=Arundo donax TaxID=35708 RepID=A0A0A9A6C8_ARUDO
MASSSVSSSRAEGLRLTLKRSEPSTRCGPPRV